MALGTDSILEVFHKTACSAGLEYLLIGGFAASYWGTPRFTADVDYVISETAYERAMHVLSQIGYQLVFLHPKKSFAHFSSREGEGFRIDLVLVDANTWEKLKGDSTVADLGGSEKYPIVSPLHLIAMKLHAAKQEDRMDVFKDLNDVAEILLAQDLTIEHLEQSGIINKYGTKETAAQLRSLLDSKRKR